MKKIMGRILERRADHLTSRIAPFLPAQGEVLDIGCGTGHNAQAINRQTGLAVHEVDVEDMKVVGPSPAIFDGQKLPFDADSFTCGIILFVLHYSEDPVRLLQEARRVISGRLIVLQSTYSGILGRRVLKCREWFSGYCSFHLARWVGLIGDCKCTLYPRDFLVRERLDNIFEQSGWDIEHFDADYWPLVKVSRDIYVLEKR